MTVPGMMTDKRIVKCRKIDELIDILHSTDRYDVRIIRRMSVAIRRMTF